MHLLHAYSHQLGVVIGQMEFFLTQGSSTRTVYTTFDKGHGRIERRIYTLDTQIGSYKFDSRTKYQSLWLCSVRKRFIVSALADCESTLAAGELVRNKRTCQ